MLNRISIHGEHPPGCCLPHVGGKQEHSPARWGKTNSHNTAVEPPKEILAAATSSDSAGLSKHLGLPSHEQIVEFTESRYKGDAYDFVFELRR